MLTAEYKTSTFFYAFKLWRCCFLKLVTRRGCLILRRNQNNNPCLGNTTSREKVGIRAINYHLEDNVHHFMEQVRVFHVDFLSRSATTNAVPYCETLKNLDSSDPIIAKHTFVSVLCCFPMFPGVVNTRHTPKVENSSRHLSGNTSLLFPPVPCRCNLNQPGSNSLVI